MHFRGAVAATIAALLFSVGLTAWSQSSCPGSDALTGFRLLVGPPGGGPMLPLTQVNELQAGDTLWYLPYHLPPEWRNSARVAVLLVPSADEASNIAVLPVRKASQPADWTVAEPVAAVALLFGPNGFNAGTIRKLASAHPELIRSFIDYASQATRVEALVALLARYEQSPPGSLNLQTMLHHYAQRYGVKLPQVNPAQPPEEIAAELLHAVAPPTAEEGPSPHDTLADSQSAAAAVASLYFAPVVGVMGMASSSVPLVEALHGMMFPGTVFRGAFAVSGFSGQDAMSLCTTNATPQRHKRLAYLWMTRLPGDAAPSLRLLRDAAPTVGRKATLAVTCGSVAQLRALMRAQSWALAAGGRRYPVPVEINVGTQSDELTLDLAHAAAPPGKYRLTAMWDWTPVVAQGTVQLRQPPPLSAARRVPGGAPLISGGGTVTVSLTGADFTSLRSVRLVAASGNIVQAAVPFRLQPDGTLQAVIVTADLAPGVYALRLAAASGRPGKVELQVLPPTPRLTGLPLIVHLGQARPTVWLRGSHLDGIERITSPGVAWTLGPARQDDPGRRAATIVPGPGLEAGQVLAAKVYVAGLAAPLALPHALKIAPPLPAIVALTEAAYNGPIALEPGELPAAALVSFAVHVAHTGDDPTFTLSCQNQDESHDALQLQPGAVAPGGEVQLETAGQDLYYLAFLPGKIGRPGCQLELTATTAGVGTSAPQPMGKIVRLPRLEQFTLSSQSAGGGQYEGLLTGTNLQLIAATGWNARHGVPVTAVPQPAPGPPGTQRLRIAMPWPPPEPHAPLYIWLYGENQGRKTNTHF